MAPRRGLSPNPLTPQESLTPNGPSSASSLQVQQPRSISPSSGFTQFLAKPSKWFSRSASTSKVPSPSPELKPVVSGGSRKHKISRPTDPRPILDSYAGGASRSVLDLSARPPGSLELSRFQTPSTPSSPITNRPSGGGGDLLETSRKAWSRSADDLSKAPPPLFSPSPIKTSFQDRVAEYRNRSDSTASAVSPSSPTSPGSIYNGRHPFPTVGNVSPSSSPPRSATLPSVSISVPKPVGEDEVIPLSTSPTQTHVHTRSHSFTPKLPSKLATPRYPVNPQRANERDEAVRDVEQPPLLGTPTRAAFNFGFGGANNHNKALHDVSTAPSTTNNRATTLLPPPTIVEPEQDRDEQDIRDPKRSSQILYHSGLINRLVDVPTNFNNHPHPPLSKGWKPFKAELKGSKLYFYKPPGDRANGIRDLFPTTLVPPSEQDDEPINDSELSAAHAEDVDGSGRPRRARGREEAGPSTMVRKKRAYWGRRTHPDLILDASGMIEKGTFEALTHESVFATTFPGLFADPSSNDDDKTRWEEFSSSVIFAIPAVVGRQAFEAEFLRCCSFLVSGAEEALHETMKAQVARLANEYVRCHGQPVDAAGWETFKQDTIPGVVLAAEGPVFSSSSGLPVSTSSEAIFHPSPVPSASTSTSSPNLNTFSPRPQDGKTISLLEALSPSVPQSQQSPRLGLAPPLTHSHFPWDALQAEGLTRDLFLCLDPFLVARSLTLYHRSVLEICPDNITAEFITNTTEAYTDQEDETISTPSYSAAPLFGSDDQPHWLTKLILLHILANDSSSSHHHHYANHHHIPAAHLSSPGRRSEDRANVQQTSRTHSRSELISIWAKIGELCRTSGDECSWRAISAALCSRPVARLDKAWKRVDPQALAAIEGWANFTGDGSAVPSVVAPQVTVWGGDVRVRVNEELAKTAGESGSGEAMAMAMVSVGHAIRAKMIFDGFRRSFLLCPRKTYVVESEVGEEVRRLVAFWGDVASQGGVTSGLAVKFQRVDQFMSLSLAVEPRRKGLFEPYFWTRTASQTPSASLVPLLFPDPLPTVTLVDRSRLVRGRYDSDNSDLQYLRSLDNQLRNDAGRQLHGLDVKQDFTKRLILGHGGTLISVYQGELLLVVQSGGFESAPNSRPNSSRAPSRPPSTATTTTTATNEHGVMMPMEKGVSRNPSIRVKPTSSHGLDRKTSIARRSSLPSVSHLNRTNFVTTELSSDPPLRVIVQAGTLQSLVNVLVHGLESISVSVADDNGEMSLREGMTRELVVDRVEFSKIWWSVFRSFVSPLVFFELLRKIYISSQPSGASPTIADYMKSVNRHREVLVTLKEWLVVGGGAQDILDDVQLYGVVESFFNSPSDHALYKSTMAEAPPVQQAWKSLMEEKEVVKATFMSQTMRPMISRGLHNRRRSQGRGGGGGGGGAGQGRSRHLSTREPPDLDRMDPEAFVDNLDGMASAAFSNVTQEDLFITADLLEVQSSDKTGWFSGRDVPSQDRDEPVEIQTIYSQIQEVEPSSLISELSSQDVLYRLLPPGVRSCIRAYSIIRKWLISKIVAPRIGLRARQARMELLIQALEVSRLRNTETPSAPQLMDQPCVRSFVEAVTTSAILSVESRLHARAWQGVGLNRGSACDTVTSLLHRPYVQSTSSPESLTVDMGWLLERMLEIISTSDVVEASSQEGQNLINFDKRRHLCNLIRKSACLPSERKNSNSEESHRRGFERLNNIEKEVLPLQFDHRGIKEEAFKEAATPGVNGGLPSNKKAIRPFHKIVTVQIEKNRRDKTLRTRLQKEKLQEQTKNERRDDLLNKAMRPRKPLTNVQKQHRNKKSMSAFLSFMRPISSAFVSDSPQHLTLRRTPSKLDFPSSGKPSLVLSIMDARVAQFVNNERSYTFQLDTEDGGHYLLQAFNKREMTKWLEVISRVTKNAAKRRLTYIANSPKPQIADHIHSHPIVASRDPQAVFGVELDFLLRREANGEHIPAGTVPLIIEQCLNVVETRGLTEVGIYRIAGATTEINSLKDAYNRGEFPIRESTDIHAICDLVKSWFRLLPEPVFPAPSYHKVMEAMRQENLDDRLLCIREVVQALPQPNFDILRRVSEHLDKVTDYEELNHMTAEALAIVFSPNLLRAPQNDFVMILNNMGLSHKLVKALITHFHIIFDEADQEEQAHESEDELDSPILEEDEPSYESSHDPNDSEAQLEPANVYTPS